MLLSGAVKPVIDMSAELMAMALRSAAEGEKPSAGTAAPVGDQPSVQYWRMSVTAPAPGGLAIDVPESVPYAAVPGPNAEVTLWPGLANVGLVRPSSVGPRLVAA